MRALLLVAIACVPWMPIGVYLAARVRRRWIATEEAKHMRERLAKESL